MVQSSPAHCAAAPRSGFRRRRRHYRHRHYRRRYPRRQRRCRRRCNRRAAACDAMAAVVAVPTQHIRCAITLRKEQTVYYDKASSAKIYIVYRDRLILKLNMINKGGKSQ